MTSFVSIIRPNPPGVSDFGAMVVGGDHHSIPWSAGVTSSECKRSLICFGTEQERELQDLGNTGALVSPHHKVGQRAQNKAIASLAFFAIMVSRFFFFFFFRVTHTFYKVPLP